MFLFVGLGNFGKEYENTRHNFGFVVVDEIMKRYGFDKPVKKFSSEVSQGKIDGNKAIIIKPQTYMNKSGVAVFQAKNFYKIPIENIVVFHDDMDLESGKIKVKVGGGDGGHNGLKSVDEMIGKNYMRVRLGIGHPNNKEEVYNYVLGKFSSKELETVCYIKEKIAELVGVLLKSREEFLTTFYLKSS